MVVEALNNKDLQLKLFKNKFIMYNYNTAFPKHIVMLLVIEYIIY